MADPDDREWRTVGTLALASVNWPMFMTGTVCEISPNRPQAWQFLFGPAMLTLFVACASWVEAKAERDIGPRGPIFVWLMAASYAPVIVLAAGISLADVPALDIYGQRGTTADLTNFLVMACIMAVLVFVLLRLAQPLTMRVARSVAELGPRSLEDVLGGLAWIAIAANLILLGATTLAPVYPGRPRVPTEWFVEAALGALLAVAVILRARPRAAPLRLLPAWRLADYRIEGQLHFFDGTPPRPPPPDATLVPGPVTIIPLGPEPSAPIQVAPGTPQVHEEALRLVQVRAAAFALCVALLTSAPILTVFLGLRIDLHK